MTNTQFLMKLKQTATKTSRFFMKVAELLKALSHNDFRGCFKSLKALQSNLEFLMEITVYTITCNNNFTDKILLKNQSHYLSVTPHT
jgi:hypothetical protein